MFSHDGSLDLGLASGLGLDLGLGLGNFLGLWDVGYLLTQTHFHSDSLKIGGVSAPSKNLIGNLGNFELWLDNLRF